MLCTDRQIQTHPGIRNGKIGQGKLACIVKYRVFLSIYRYAGEGSYASFRTSPIQRSVPTRHVNSIPCHKTHQATPAARARASQCSRMGDAYICEAHEQGHGVSTEAIHAPPRTVKSTRGLSGMWFLVS
jgi:hypothetical protein